MSNLLIQIIDRTGDKKTDTLPTIADVAEAQEAAKPALSVADVKSRLDGKSGRAYWRCLDELSDDPKFERLLEREFPQQAPRDMAPLARRDFLKLMGASLALAGVTGCAFQPQEEIVSQVKGNDDQVPSMPQFYATAMTMSGYALGLLAESNSGRPTKIEGNPQHPSSLGATDIWAQAEILSMYDPERAQEIRKLNANATWEDFTGAMDSALRTLQKDGGRGFHLLTETITSPTLANQIAGLQRAMPNMTWHQWEPVTRDGARQGAQQSFGAPTHLVYRFDRADRILSLDADFLLEEVGHVRYARDFSNRRRARQKLAPEMGGGMNRLYMVESTPTITGAMADNRLPVKPSLVQAIATAIAAKMKVPGATAPAGITEAQQKWIDEVARDLQAAGRGTTVVVAGSHQPAAVHVVAHAINDFLGNLNATVIGHDPIEARPVGATEEVNRAQSITELAQALDSKQVKLLMILGGNPAFTAPDLVREGNRPVGEKTVSFAQLLETAVMPRAVGQAQEGQVQGEQTDAVVVHLSDHDDETSALSTWHIPACHFLESWGDARAHDGTLSIQQPLIQPLYAECKSPHEVLAAFELNPNRSPLEIVQRYHQEQRPGLAEAAFEKQWIKWIHDGVVPNTAARPRTLAFRGTIAPVAPIGAADKVDDQNIEVIFRPDPTLWDGRYANNAWLQELPKPLLKTVWDNAAVMSFAMAQRLNVSNDSMVRVRVPASGKMISLPVIIQPGHPDGAVTLHYGYGRTRAGKVGNDTGFNVYPLRPADALHFATGGIEAAGGTHRVAHTAHHNLIDPDKKTVDGIHERPLVQIATWDQFSKNPAQVVHEETRKSLPVTGLTQQGRIDTHKEHAATGEHGGPGEGHKAGEGEHKAAPFGGQHKGEGEHGPSDGKDKKRKGFPTLYDTSRDTVLNDDEISYAWGMSVDTSTCIGCNACVIACQSENNSAVTGKDQVLMGRTLHWMRIDTYYHGDVAEPEVYFQPVMCMHCEKAPCEPVCPVIATQHSPEGINEMVYNRCIGTRYCSNNCPYKVRRFNYLQYSDQDTPQIQLMANPDVTVRARGVMEKCTYCIQRVHEGRIQTEKEDRLLRDGEVLTACQQVCPTNTIIFGDIRNEKSLVSRLKNEPHDYGMLTELNTYPRTTYLAKIHNPNPALRIAQNEEGTEAIKPADHPLKPEGDASGGIGVTGH